MTILLLFVTVVAALATATAAVLRYYPAFGRKPAKEHLSRNKMSVNYGEGIFVNQIPTSLSMNAQDLAPLLKQYMRGIRQRKPRQPLPMADFDVKKIRSRNQPAVTWFGHSAALLELDGQALLLDPMFGLAPSPFPFIGSKRYSRSLPFRIEHLPRIDAVILSHDHYDHLDYGSIKKLKDKVQQFIVPLGVGSHLERWGVEPNRIKQLDWWDEYDCQGIKLVCTPARHFSGRSLHDRNTTLWCSWVVKGKQASVYFSGDSGYGPHFAEIGQRFGPFDFTLMECGQYNESWAAIHMMPEQTVQAHLDVRGGVMLPIHWAAFTLAMHAWTDPIERVTRRAKEQGVKVATPRIGQTVPIIVGSEVDDEAYPNAAWWR
ncbi:MBL fold metallo-hydrolase [Paenibacillus xylaniclasticus]|uniref:MBL fold metallo-hydrolase n=1 Tax=Paenibacillus xylaniclasticus TaxID=588083 RepID=UPI000FD91AE6|nr:MBL fold metallo-hydrolase [Paenibacillus xylaniclasticus]